MSYSMSSSSSSKSYTTPKETHDVFLSFRGEDTRKTFTSHLNSALKRLDIKTYIDDMNLERGDEISQALLRAIEEAKLCVIVFSKNFATSKWCLDEVVKIIECRKYKGQIILPVFYGVDPSHVRHQLGSYAEAFVKHEEQYESNKNLLEKWKEALAEAASHSGWDCSVNRTEAEVVEEITKDVLEKLNRVYVIDLDIHINKLEQLAKLQRDDFREYDPTVERIKELIKMKNIRMLRVPPEMLSYMKDSESRFHWRPYDPR